MKWKVCGMKQPENILDIAAHSPTYMGFIFWEPSPRYMDQPLPEGLSPKLQKVGVFVDATEAEIRTRIDQYKLQAVQLHGQESPDFCAKLRSPHLQVIKAFSIGSHFDFDRLTPYTDACDFFLFDTQGPKPGGNGTTFDWTLLNDYPLNKPFFLSGGIGLEDLPKIHALTKTTLPIHAIDVNSKFERKPGIKNSALIHQLKQQL